MAPQKEYTIEQLHAYLLVPLLGGRSALAARCTFAQKAAGRGVLGLRVWGSEVWILGSLSQRHPQQGPA